jgi:hypothetical protein
VLSVHTIVSFDFADLGHPRLAHDDLPALLRRRRHLLRLRHGADAGCHPARKIFKLEDFITVRHVENMNKIILVTG